MSVETRDGLGLRVAGPPPLPPQPIAYRTDVEQSLGWAEFVKVVGAVGSVAAAGSLGQLFLTFLPAVGLRPLWPVTVRQFMPMGFAVVPAALLLVGSIGCLSLRPIGRAVMIAYSIAALLMSLLTVGYVAMRSLTGIGPALGSRQGLGYMLYSVLGVVPAAALPVILLALMTRPQVKRVFGAG